MMPGDQTTRNPRDPGQSRWRAAADERPFTAWQRELAELADHARCYLQARLGRYAAVARQKLTGVAFAICAMLLVVTFLVTCVVFVVAGLTGLVSAALGGNFGAAAVIVGAGGLALAALIAYLGAKQVERSARKKAISAYERQELDRRRKFGRNVEDVANNGRHSRAHGSDGQ